MSNRILDGRQTLVDALTPLLPGRVQAYKPSRVVPPMMWVETPSVTVVESMIVASFPVFGVVDGADHSQQAVLDDMIARAWDACRATAGLRARLVQPRDIPVDASATAASRGYVAPGESMRGFVLTVDVPVNARNLCPPTVEPIEVPPIAYVEV